MPLDPALSFGRSGLWCVLVVICCVVCYIYFEVYDVLVVSSSVLFGGRCALLRFALLRGVFLCFCAVVSFGLLVSVCVCVKYMRVCSYHCATATECFQDSSSYLLLGCMPGRGAYFTPITLLHSVCGLCVPCRGEASDALGASQQTYLLFGVTLKGDVQ